MEDILLMVLVFGGGITIALAFSPIGRAVSERIRGGPPRDRADAAQLDEVVADLQEVRRELSELSERMDFTERLLAKQREAERLRPPHWAGGSHGRGRRAADSHRRRRRARCLDG